MRRLACFFVALLSGGLALAAEPASPQEVLAGLKKFYAATARPDGSFQPGVDPQYAGMSDCSHSDLAAVTYACTLHKTFGWRLPHEEATIKFLLSRQRESGEFFNVAGTVEPDSAEGKTYNTTQGLVALHALGLKPKFNPLPVFEEILKQDYKTLPAFSTSFFPLAYLCYDQPIPAQADRGIRELMVQDDDGYLNNHVAATFHASHYYSLVGEPTPKSRQMVERMLRDQRPDGSWLCNMPSRDRHATFDAVFTLRHEGGDRQDCHAAIAKAVKWILSCRNADGGFGHYPGSTSDADAVYFHVGALVMAGYLKPVDPLPRDPHLLSWGHLMPLGQRSREERTILEVPGWVGGVALNAAGNRLAVASSDARVRVYDLESRKLLETLVDGEQIVTSVAFAAKDDYLVFGSYDKSAKAVHVESKRMQRALPAHRGPVMCVAASPKSRWFASGGIDGVVHLTNLQTSKVERLLSGHKSWVNSVAFSSDGKKLVSGSSDGTVKIWSVENGECEHTIAASKAEVRAVAISPDGGRIAAGIRYGTLKVWNTEDWSEAFQATKLAGDVWSVVFAMDGTLISGNGDWNKPGKVTSWDTRSGQQLRQLEHTGEVLSIAIGQEHVVAGGGDKAVSIWKLNTDSK